VRATDWSPQVDRKCKWHEIARVCIFKSSSVLDELHITRSAHGGGVHTTSTSSPNELPARASVRFSGTDFALAGFVRQARETERGLCGPWVTSLPCNLLAEVREIFLCSKLVPGYIGAGQLVPCLCPILPLVCGLLQRLNVHVQGQVHASLTVTKAQSLALPGPHWPTWRFR
jgi:hypothetical protein